MVLTYFASCNVEIKVGDCIGQIMFLRPEEVCFKEVSDFTDRTARGCGGFGSTNSKS